MSRFKLSHINHQDRRDIEAAKREKVAAAKAKEDIKRKIEQDKLERAAKRAATATTTAPASLPSGPTASPSSQAASFEACVIQVFPRDHRSDFLVAS